MDRFSSYLDKLQEESRLRNIPYPNQSLIDLVSNDYLGLGKRHDEFTGEFLERYGDAGFSSSASRLLSREQKYHNLLEETLGKLYRRDILLFNSGYQANVGVLSALASPDTLIISDSLMHASAIDGMMLGKGFEKVKVEKWQHNDLSHLEVLLENNASKYTDVIIVTESIFSMDGDKSPLHDIVKLKKKYPNALLYVDEAHALGVRGQKGLGLCEESGLADDVDIIIGTFGKALASSGAFMATNRRIRDYILNRARSFIFSTALPPINVAWTLFMLEKSMKMTDARENLLTLSVNFRKKLAAVTDKENSTKLLESDTQIIPYLCGNAERAIKVSELLRNEGYDVLPIRRPTVPPGGERIRLSLNAELTPALLSPIPEILSAAL